MAIASFCDHCGAENTPGETICHACQHLLAQPFPPAETNRLLNERYAIMHEVGAGGFGAVYLARDTHEGERLVAVKQINLQGLSSQEIIEATDAFNREAEILSTLSHPLLPTIFDRFSDPAHWYLVMTYIDGSTLDEYLQQQRVKALPASTGLPLSETLEIALRLCDALHYLHTQQPSVIFRDLKPGNIMRTRKGQLYLIDFGIARRFKPGQAKDTIPFGSPGFAAPEQYGRAQTTPQADIYSLGALLYCLITGDDPSEHPFDFPPLHQYGTDGIRELNALIQHMVTPDPMQRPANIREVQIELQRIQQLNLRANQQGRIWIPPQSQTPPANGKGQQPSFLNPLTPSQKPRKTTRRAVLITSLVLGGVAAVGGLAALSNQSQMQPISRIDPDQAWAQQTAAAQNAEATATTASLTPAVPLNGPTFWSDDMLYAAVVNMGEQQIEIYHSLGAALTQTIKMPANFISPAIWWSPDKSKILGMADSGMIYTWNVANGTQLFSFTSAMDGYVATYPPVISWSPDSQLCAISYSASGNTYFTLLQANNGTQLFQKSLSSPTYGTVSNVAWSPDNRYFAFPGAVAWASGQAWSANIWDRQTYQLVNSFGATLPTYTPSFSYGITSIAWSPDGQKLATSIDGSIYISSPGMNAPINTLVRAFTGINTSVNSSIWSPNGKYLAFLMQNVLSVYDIANSQQVSLNGDGYPPANYITAFSWAADSQSLLVADDRNNLWSWEIDNY